jgi:hypothetical protein
LLQPDEFAVVGRPWQHPQVANALPRPQTHQKRELKVIWGDCDKSAYVSFGPYDLTAIRAVKTSSTLAGIGLDEPTIFGPGHDPSKDHPSIICSSRLISPLVSPLFEFAAHTGVIERGKGHVTKRSLDLREVTAVLPLGAVAQPLEVGATSICRQDCLKCLFDLSASYLASQLVAADELR